MTVLFNGTGYLIDVSDFLDTQGMYKLKYFFRWTHSSFRLENSYLSVFQDRTGRQKYKFPTRSYEEFDPLVFNRGEFLILFKCMVFISWANEC